MPAYNYSTVADIYDSFCVFDGDVDFMRKLTLPVGGPVLELMAGTGRISLPLALAGVQLTCIDQSAAMLRVLSQKLQSHRLTGHLAVSRIHGTRRSRSTTQVVRRSESLIVKARMFRLHLA